MCLHGPDARARAGGCGRVGALLFSAPRLAENLGSTGARVLKSLRCNSPRCSGLSACCCCAAPACQRGVAVHSGRQVPAAPLSPLLLRFHVCLSADSGHLTQYNGGGVKRRSHAHRDTRLDAILLAVYYAAGKELQDIGVVRLTAGNEQHMALAERVKGLIMDKPLYDYVYASLLAAGHSLLPARGKDGDKERGGNLVESCCMSICSRALPHACSPQTCPDHPVWPMSDLGWPHARGVRCGRCDGQLVVSA